MAERPYVPRPPLTMRTDVATSAMRTRCYVPSKAWLRTARNDEPVHPGKLRPRKRADDCAQHACAQAGPRETKENGTDGAQHMARGSRLRLHAALKDVRDANAAPGERAEAPPASLGDERPGATDARSDAPHASTAPRLPPPQPTERQSPCLLYTSPSPRD